MTKFASIPSNFLLVPFAAIFLWFTASTAFPTATNTTILLPEGTSNYGNPDILCTPATWVDIALFLLINYGAHAATVRSMPGEKIMDTIFNTLIALCFPYSGIVRGLDAIARCAILECRNELQMAARAGALCQVVRAHSVANEQNGVTEENGITEKNSFQTNSIEVPCDE
jgi:hypothetical protein